VTQLMQEPETRQKIDLQTYVTPKVGLPTLTDILAELAKPGRDPRKQFEAFQFAEGVNKMSDLTPGLRVPGIVTNVAAFGAFVDVGVHQDGLVHVSQLADRFVKDPAEIVKVGQHVMVTVLEVDLERKRISLTMRSSQERPERQQPERQAHQGPRERTQGPRSDSQGIDAKPAPRHRREPAPQRQSTTTPEATPTSDAKPKDVIVPKGPIPTGPAAGPMGPASSKPGPRKDKTPPPQRYDQPLNNNPFSEFFKNYKPKK